MGSPSASNPFRSLCFFSALLLLVGRINAEITLYTTQGVQAVLTTAPGAVYTGVAAYNPGSLTAPAPPNPTVLTTIPIPLQNSGTPNLSIKQKGSFLGFSIEMSVTNQVFPFLNLMANIQQRAGSVMIRVGGNSQESAKLVDDGVIPDGRILTKNLTGVTGTTQTPPLEFSRDLLYLMRNISSFVNIHWFVGIPWFITQPFDTGIIKAADEILGDYLLGLQAGNEPDMYNLHGHRNASYSPFDYGGEMSDLIAQVASEGADPSGRAMTSLVSPSIADFGAWTPEAVWNSGLLATHGDNIAYMSVEKYPRDNCAAMFGAPGNPDIVDPQSVLSLYLTHDAHTQLLQPYLNSTMFAQQVGKPFLMFETNTASCGGFLGISDSFTAALWGIDYALQMAHSNFSGAMFHLGGQNVFYNPFTSPPTNESSFHQWSVGSLYYSALVMAEAMGPSNNTQVLNIGVDNLSSLTPIYGIYENGTPVRVAVINYIDDPSGANTVHAIISIAGATIPSSVKVKYLAAKTVVQKGNYTWAGQVSLFIYPTNSFVFGADDVLRQTFGGIFESDGRPMGQEDIQTVNCDTTAQTCTVDVPAPGMALVFLTDDALTETKGAPATTFSTTVLTKTRNTATIDPAVLSTSNGNRFDSHELAGTSKPPKDAAPRATQASVVVVGVVIGAILAAEITLYRTQGAQAAFSDVPGATYTGVAAYNPTSLIAPAPPNPTVLTTIPINLQNSGTPNLSIKQKGSFIGFSIEMSVTNQVLGKNSTLIQVPFLNLMANIQQRAGSIMVRVGGNTQESAKLVPDGTIPDGRILMKDLTNVTGTTQTPPLEYTRDLLYLMRNISSFVNVHWFIGIPWFIIKPKFDTAIIQAADEILGDYLLGMQAANEPDMYRLNKHRDPTQPYTPYDYGGEMRDFLEQVKGEGMDVQGTTMKKLVAPNIAMYDWTPEQVWDSGLIDNHGENIAWLAVEKYPRHNCALMFGGPNDPGRINPQDVLPLYLTHDEHTKLLQPYLNSTMYAQQVGKPFLMFETNTGSCGGFMGISDSFTAALWGIDYALQLAHSNFSGAMFHLGGQNVFYNPFTSPPTNETSFHQWTVGPIYYSALIMAEAMGASNNTQVFNYGVDNLSGHTPIYGIYENGTPVRVTIINYIDDPSGANTVHAKISVAGRQMPSSVKVKYLAAKTVVQKGGYTWAGQTFGGIFESDGRPMGEEDIKTVECDTNAQTCTVDVPAPGMALVFLNDDAFTEGKGAPAMTFPTTVHTKTHNTATVDPAVLSTSNGNRFNAHELAGTSKPPKSNAIPSASASAMALGFLVGAALTIFGRAAAYAATAAGAAYTGVAAYNPTMLVAPPVPSPAVLTDIPINLQQSGTPGISIKQKGSFFGFSIEMSVSNQVPFLNLMANIVSRAGSVMVRVGGNSQESAELVDDSVIPDGRIITKNLTGVTGRTQTPPLEYRRDLLVMMAKISSLVNVHWFVGIPWFETKPFATAIIKAADELLGDHLLGLQAGNEPDMYHLHGHRGETYSPFDYGGEMNDLLAQVAGEGVDTTGRAMKSLVSPSIATFAWTLQQVWDSGLLDNHGDNIAFLSVEKYPRDNCAAMFGGPNDPGIINPQDVLPLYLTHDAHTQLLEQYLASTAFAQTKGKPFLMFETNSGACGGFMGISDSFTAALWGLDYALQMAHSNFSGAMFHVGGQNVFYNPFTAPPTNESTFHQWTVGPIYYSALVMAEAMGPSNNTQVFNYGVANLSSSTPIYGIYENGVPVRVAIINYLDDPSGASTVHARISVAGRDTPLTSVKVKYLLAKTVVQKGGYTWAGQTFGGNFESDGRPMGEEEIKTVDCDTNTKVCTVDVPAPGMALVFLDDNAFTENKGAPAMTFPTTVHTKTRNTGEFSCSVHPDNQYALPSGLISRL
ncbi:hypothetical protein R3P38DRAFT_2530271 [Favolaschia claudopus]|uniref:Beta-glucuronidase C-terminal domain-containing protein n=1 Tax=Favolaschia claudopus TaxID=2862362 RepID=A0AAW0BF62_9AGAR